MWSKRKWCPIFCTCSTKILFAESKLIFFILSGTLLHFVWEARHLWKNGAEATASFNSTNIHPCLQILCILWFLRETQQIYGSNYFTNIDKSKTFPLKQNLTYANDCSYVATCVICRGQHVGQTINTFSTTWSAQGGSLSKPRNKNDSS